MWVDLVELLFYACDACGHPGAAAEATILLDGEGTEGRPRYLFLTVLGLPSPEAAERGRAFLVEHGLSPVQVAKLVPVRVPTPGSDAGASVLSTLEADPAIAAQVERHERRGKVISALVNLGAVTAPGQVREMLRACPELATDGVEAEGELSTLLNWPPEAASLIAARGALIRVLASPVTDIELEIAYEAFSEARQAAMKEMVQAGQQKFIWLARHEGEPDATWDPVAKQALRLVGLGGDRRGKAMLLHYVGTQVAGRPNATPAQVNWGVQCLRDSRELWLMLGDSDEAAVAGSDLAAALHAGGYGDVYAKMAEAEVVLREVVAYRSEAGQAGMLGVALTNLAMVILRAAQFDQRHDRIQEAVDLCRRALPLRPKAEDPYGWAFCAANLALALRRLRDPDPVTRRSQLQEAAAVSQEAAVVFDAHSDVAAADQACVNRLGALLDLAAELRSDRLRAVVGSDVPMSPDDLASVLETNPAMFGLTETPPEVSAVLNAPAPPDETRILQDVLSEAEALLAQPRMGRNPGIRSQLARLTASASWRLLGPTGEAAAAVTVARRLIDATVDPDDAAVTSAELGTLYARLDRWAEAAAAYDDCLAVIDRTLQDSVGRERVMQALAQFRTLARWTAYAHLRCDDPQQAVTVLERTRSRALPRIVPGVGRGLEFLSWRAATLDDIGRAATPGCPVAYVLTAFAGSAVLLVRRGKGGNVTVTAHESSLSSGSFSRQMWSLLQPEQAFLTAQMIGADMGPAIASLAEPLGSLLEPVVANLVADGVRDLVLIPAGPAAVLPWAAATIRLPGDQHPTPVVELLTVSVAPSAAAVVLGRERAADRVRSTAAGRILVVADPERPDAEALPGARDEARRIEAAFPGRVDLLDGAAAQTAAVMRRLPASWIVHLACHGVNDVLQPEAMRLQLSDGDVTLDQLLQLPELRARLVALSACQTGHVTVTGASDEMLGLPVAFLQAGACAVVSTLWPVNDYVTAMLMGRLYEELTVEFDAAGQGDVAAALARAQRWLRSLPLKEALRLRGPRGTWEQPDSQPPLAAGRSPFAAPYFWAGFIAYGR
jgi:CHAT domain-containing protein